MIAYVAQGNLPLNCTEWNRFKFRERDVNSIRSFSRWKNVWKNNNFRFLSSLSLSHSTSSSIPYGTTSGLAVETKSKFNIWSWIFGIVYSHSTIACDLQLFQVSSIFLHFNFDFAIFRERNWTNCHQNLLCILWLWFSSNWRSAPTKCCVVCRQQQQ